MTSSIVVCGTTLVEHRSRDFQSDQGVLGQEEPVLPRAARLNTSACSHHIAVAGHNDAEPTKQLDKDARARACAEVTTQRDESTKLVARHMTLHPIALCCDTSAAADDDRQHRQLLNVRLVCRPRLHSRLSTTRDRERTTLACLRPSLKERCALQAMAMARVRARACRTPSPCLCRPLSFSASPLAA